jgi:4-amino-4-deoxy-L-arabinose transferase-like glycosyltransferase
MSARDYETQIAGQRRQTMFLAAALVAALLFRIYLLAAHDFPINDGALFLEFIRATAATFPGLPTEAAYNGLILPFAYPPLSFWLGALLTKAGVDSLAVVRVLPILMNMGYVLLFALLLLKSGRSRAFTALAILLLAVNLRSFEWLLMGAE